MPFTVPVLRLTLNHMKHAIQMALMAYSGELDQMLTQAIEDYCTPENLTQIVNEQVHRTIPQIIQEAVERYYRYGEGREEVRAAIETFFAKKRGEEGDT